MSLAIAPAAIDEPVPVDFDELVAKIAAAPFRDEPFRHLCIEGFFPPDQFAAITRHPQVRLPTAHDDDDLLRLLHAAGYEAVGFPAPRGGAEGEEDPEPPGRGAPPSAAAEPRRATHGLTLRLKQPAPGSILAALTRFMRSRRFCAALADRFAIDLERVAPEVAIQKDLDGHEVPPNPGTRRKALAFRVNINPAGDSDRLDFHTHHMRLRPEHAQLRERWRAAGDLERRSVPWSACETVWQQRANNSLVAFAPGEDTLQGTRARYDHLLTQRTQCCGNLWYLPPGERSAAWGWQAKLKGWVSALRG